jgi:hypothetical protein
VLIYQEKTVMKTTCIVAKSTPVATGFIVRKSLVEATAHLKQGGVSNTRLKKGDCC